MLVVRSSKGTSYIRSGGVSSKAFAGHKSKDPSKRDYFVDWYILAGMSDTPHEVEDLIEDFGESDFKEEGYTTKDIREGIRRLFEVGYIEEYK